MSHQQKTIVLSSTEAEYIALSDCGHQFVSRLLTMDLTFIFVSYFIFSFSFLFLFLEQLRLGVISHAVTSVTT